MYNSVRDVNLNSLLKSGDSKVFFSGIFHNLQFYRNVTSYASKFNYKCKLSSTRIVIDDDNGDPIIAYAVACWLTKI